MSEQWKHIGRREFIRRFSFGLPVAGTVASGLTGCATSGRGIPGLNIEPPSEPPETDVSLVTGSDRRQMMIDSLEPLRSTIEKEIAGKRVLIKINCNRPDEQLIKTHPDAVRGVLDVITPLAEREIMVGESTALDVPSRQTFEHFGYYALEREYPVRIVELNEDPVTYQWILNRDLHPERIGILNSFLDPDVYLISVTMLKTHDTAITTLTAKNVIMGSPLKNPSRGVNFKSRMHGFGSPGTPSYPTSAKLLDINMFKIAHVVQPDLCVLDGLVGAEGEGPNKCEPVDHGVALAGTDFVAVDLIGSEMMGVPWEKIGFLKYCATGGLGQSDRRKINVIGKKPEDHTITYKLHPRAWWQFEWEKPIDWGLIHPAPE